MVTGNEVNDVSRKPVYKKHECKVAEQATVQRRKPFIKKDTGHNTGHIYIAIDINKDKRKVQDIHNLNYSKIIHS